MALARGPYPGFLRGVPVRVQCPGACTSQPGRPLSWDQGKAHHVPDSNAFPCNALAQERFANSLDTYVVFAQRCSLLAKLHPGTCTPYEATVAAAPAAMPDST